MGNSSPIRTQLYTSGSRWTENSNGWIIFKSRSPKPTGFLRSWHPSLAHTGAPKPKLLQWAYTGIVMCILTNGVLAWGHVIDEEPKYIKSLRKLNRMAMNNVVKVPRSAHTQGLEIILDVTPLHLQIKCECLATFHYSARFRWSVNQPHLLHHSSTILGIPGRECGYPEVSPLLRLIQCHQA